MRLLKILFVYTLDSKDNWFEKNEWCGTLAQENLPQCVLCRHNICFLTVIQTNIWPKFSLCSRFFGSILDRKYTPKICTHLHSTSFWHVYFSTKNWTLFAFCTQFIYTFLNLCLLIYSTFISVQKANSQYPPLLTQKLLVTKVHIWGKCIYVNTIFYLQDATIELTPLCYIATQSVGRSFFLSMNCTTLKICIFWKLMTYGLL